MTSDPKDLPHLPEPALVEQMWGYVAADQAQRTAGRELVAWMRIVDGAHEKFGSSRVPPYTTTLFAAPSTEGDKLVPMTDAQILEVALNQYGIEGQLFGEGDIVNFARDMMAHGRTTEPA